MLPDFRKSIAYWKRPTLRPFFLLVHSMQMKVVTEPWCYKIDRRKSKYSEKNLTNCHFLHHKFHEDWPVLETWPPSLEDKRLHIIYKGLTSFLPENRACSFEMISPFMLCGEKY